MKKGIVGSALVPGMPHLLSAEKSPAWQSLRDGMRRLEEAISATGADTLMIYSTQWMSVLGNSFQCQANPRGVHVDENWHEWGDLKFDFKSEVALAKSCAEYVGKSFPVKLVDYDCFPVDTGTIVALELLNQNRKLPVVAVSSWVYADGEKTATIGHGMRAAAEDSGRRVFALGVSSLSQRYFTDEIDPATDKISNADDERAIAGLMGRLEGGDLAGACALLPELNKVLPLDMGGNALQWLRGVTGTKPAVGRVLGFGPIWGTSNAVVYFPNSTVEETP